MAVTPDDVRHVASLARLGLTPEALQAYVAELNTILEHMDVLSQVDTSHIDSATESVAGLPLRQDAGPPIALERDREDFAPKMRDGFFLVPRLSTHEEPESAS